MRLKSGFCARDPHSPPTPALSTGLPVAVLMAALTAALCVLPGPVAWAQNPPAAQAPVSSSWKQLSARDRQALAPLAEHWADISEIQRSKWLAIARNFDQLPPADQQLMQTRMREWAALSPVQRSQARLNFNTLQNLPRDEKKSRWDEYQNLSESEKRKLNAATLGPARTAAPSTKPAATDRLVQPTVRSVPAAALPQRTPIDRHTLLPVPTAPVSNAPLAAAAASAPAEASGPLESSEDVSGQPTPTREASAP